jgi:hypothetical protein
MGFLLGGCVDQCPNVKLAVDKVASVTAAEAFPGNEEMDKDRLIVTDTEIVARCVAEFNGLSLEGSRRATLTQTDRCVFSDAAGKPIVCLGYGGRLSYPLPHVPEDCLQITIDDYTEYDIKFQPVPTINRLFAYRRLRIAMGRLEARAAKAEWSDGDREALEYGMRILSCYMPLEALPVPRNPAELRKFLKDHPLPPLTIETLEKLKDYPQPDDRLLPVGRRGRSGAP